MKRNSVLLFFVSCDYTSNSFLHWHLSSLFIFREEWDARLLHSRPWCQNKRHGGRRVPAAPIRRSFDHVRRNPNIRLVLLGASHNLQPQPSGAPWQLEIELGLDAGRVHLHHERCLSVHCRLLWLHFWPARNVLRRSRLRQCVELRKKADPDWSPSDEVQRFEPRFQALLLPQRYYFAAVDGCEQVHFVVPASGFQNASGS